MAEDDPRHVGRESGGPRTECTRGRTARPNRFSIRGAGGVWYPSGMMKAEPAPAEIAAYRRRLKEILVERSIRFGDFTLSSGAKSTYYADVRRTSLHPEGALLIAKLLDPILLEYRVKAVGGLTLGADPIVGATIAWTEQLGRGLIGFIVRKELKAHGTGSRIEGPFDATLPTAIVDDVIRREVPR